jgi:hypothetical protein
LDGVDVEPTIEPLALDHAQSSAVAVQVLQSLLPPLNEPEGFVALPRSNGRSNRARRAGHSPHFDPNRFHYPSPFLAHPHRIVVKDGVIPGSSSIATSSSSSGAGNAGMIPMGSSNSNGADKYGKKSKQKKDRGPRPREKTKSQTHGMAVHKGGSDRRPLLDADDVDESTTSEEENGADAGGSTSDVSGRGGQRGGLYPPLASSAMPARAATAAATTSGVNGNGARDFLS